MTMRAVRLLLGAAVGIMALPALALAQDDAALPPASVAPVAAGQQTADGRTTYTPEFFARFAPSDALDMLDQVPGFSIRAAAQERGLGQVTGNVLINGQRLSTKSEDIFSQLSHISVAKVQRIEIVDGATFNIPGPDRSGRQRDHGAERDRRALRIQGQRPPEIREAELFRRARPR